MPARSYSLVIVPVSLSMLSCWKKSFFLLRKVYFLPKCVFFLATKKFIFLLRKISAEKCLFASILFSTGKSLLGCFWLKKVFFLAKIIFWFICCRKNSEPIIVYTNKYTQYIAKSNQSQSKNIYFKMCIETPIRTKMYDVISAVVWTLRIIYKQLRLSRLFSSLPYAYKICVRIRWFVLFKMSKRERSLSGTHTSSWIKHI